MKQTPKRWRLLLAAVALTSAACMAAQPPARKPRAQGLDSLEDRAVAAELSSRGIDNLLDHYFKVNNTSEEQRNAIKTFGALRDLKNPSISPAEKMKRVKAVVDGIDTVLPSLKDPQQMAEVATTILEYGVNQRVNNLEYFGEDPITQAQLKPMVEAMYKLLVAAGNSARAQADQLANVLKGDKDPRAKTWQAMDELANTAEYTKSMTAYFRCLGRPASDPDRKKIAETAIVALGDYDNADMGVQPRVRNMIAKLEMAAGQYKSAKKGFQNVITGTDITPKPNPYELFEARYFSTVVDVLSKDLTAAKSDKTALDDWSTKVMPGELKKYKVPAAQIAAGQKSNGAALELLQWRVLLLQSEKSPPGERGKIDDAAEAVLLKLRETHPELQYMIDEQLVKRMDPKKPIDDRMASSILLALIKKAKIESYKGASETIDQAVINKGIEAARALAKRKGQTGVTPASLEDAALTVAVLLEKLGQKVESAGAYLDYAVDFYSNDPKKGADALNYAGWLIFNMKKEATPPLGFEELYTRFLPVAINPPFNHRDLAYSYAEQLRVLGQDKAALKFFRMVPPGDKAFGLAQYKEMIVLSNILSEPKQDPSERKQTVADLLKVADEVRAAGINSSDVIARGKAAHAATILAKVARMQDHDPKRALAALDGLEDLAKGQPPEKEKALIHEAMNERVYAQLELGNMNEAVALLTKMLEGTQGDEGIYLVQKMLTELDKEFAAAQGDHNKDKMRETASNQAALTGRLADWCNPVTQKNATIGKLYYAYKVYDARTHRIAGSLAEDPGERKRLLEAAQGQYKALEAGDMHTLYIAQPAVKAQIADGKIDPADPDPAVATGLALTDFDLGNYKSCKEHLEPMLAAKQFGNPMIEQSDLAGTKLVDNDLYWEAWYKFIKSDYEISKGNPADTTTVGKILKNVLLQGNVPARYAEDFEQLRKDLVPDFNPAAVPVLGKPAASPVPATTPSAGTASVGQK